MKLMKNRKHLNSIEAYVSCNCSSQCSCSMFCTCGCTTSPFMRESEYNTTLIRENNNLLNNLKNRLLQNRSNISA